MHLHNSINYFRGLLYNGKNNMQAWGLIVLLLSKAAGHLNVNEMEEDKAAGVLYRYLLCLLPKLHHDVVNLECFCL